MKHTPWLERKFTFDYPVTHAPFFMERLRGIYPRLKEMTAGLSDVQLSRKEGKAWSMKEHIGHLSDLEVLHDRRIEDYLQGKEVLSAADMSNQATNEAHHNVRPVESLLEQFNHVRTAFIARLEKLEDEVYSRSALHPRLKVPMRLVDMIYFVAEHDDHHLVLMRRMTLDY
jgi:uncharacterized damage-inducible protein DinB